MQIIQLDNVWKDAPMEHSDKIQQGVVWQIVSKDLLILKQDIAFKHAQLILMDIFQLEFA